MIGLQDKQDVWKILKPLQIIEVKNSIPVSHHLCTETFSV